MSGALEEPEVPVDEFKHYNYEHERLVTRHGGE
jgi:hypothetical protein